MINDNDTSTPLHCCVTMAQHLDQKELAIVYVPQFREYGLRVLDSGSSYILLNFCPWCGTQLASRLRDAWFKEIERLGFDPGSPGIPEGMTTDRWWNHSK